MEFWKDSTHKRAYHIQDILECICLQIVLKNIISNVPETRSRFCRFLEKHWVVLFIVYAFHMTTFFFSIRCIYNTDNRLRN